MDIVGEVADADGNSALKLAYKTVPDVVLMDIQMPGMGGIGTTRALVHLLPDVLRLGSLAFGVGSAVFLVT